MANKNLNPDIAYQPKTQSFSFSRTPKVEKTKLTKNTFFTLCIIIFLNLLFFLTTIVILNYFNFLPLSNRFPTVFGFLPALYNFSASETALKDAPYSKELGTYYLVGTLASVGNNKISIRYIDKVADFVLGADLQCEKLTVSNFNNDKQELNTRALCNEVLKNEYVGNAVIIVYEKVPQKYYVLRSISIKVN